MSSWVSRSALAKSISIADGSTSADAAAVGRAAEGGDEDAADGFDGVTPRSIGGIFSGLRHGSSVRCRGFGSCQMFFFGGGGGGGAIGTATHISAATSDAKVTCFERQPSLNGQKLVR